MSCHLSLLVTVYRQEWRRPAWFLVTVKCVAVLFLCVCVIAWSKKSTIKQIARSVLQSPTEKTSDRSDGSDHVLEHTHLFMSCHSCGFKKLFFLSPTCVYIIKIPTSCNHIDAVLGLYQKAFKWPLRVYPDGCSVPFVSFYTLYCSCNGRIKSVKYNELQYN